MYRHESAVHTRSKSMLRTIKYDKMYSSKLLLKLINSLNFDLSDIISF